MYVSVFLMEALLILLRISNTWLGSVDISLNHIRNFTDPCKGWRPLELNLCSFNQLTKVLFTRKTNCDLVCICSDVSQCVFWQNALYCWLYTVCTET